MIQWQISKPEVFGTKYWSVTPQLSFLLNSHTHPCLNKAFFCFKWKMVFTSTEKTRVKPATCPGKSLGDLTGWDYTNFPRAGIGFFSFFINNVIIFALPFFFLILITIIMAMDISAFSISYLVNPTRIWIQIHCFLFASKSKSLCFSQRPSHL